MYKTRSIIVNDEIADKGLDIIRSMKIPVYAVHNSTYSQIKLYTNRKKSFSAKLVCNHILIQMFRSTLILTLKCYLQLVLYVHA
jgi:hypothetical protein